MLSSDPEFLASVHSVVAGVDEIASEFQSVIDIATAAELPSIPINIALLVKLHAMMTTQNTVVRLLLEENEQIREGLEKLEQTLTEKK